MEQPGRAQDLEGAFGSLGPLASVCEALSEVTASRTPGGGNQGKPGEFQNH